VLAEALGRFDAAKWAAAHPEALNGGVATLAVIGVLIQAWTSPKKEKGQPEEKPREKPAPPPVSPPPPEPPTEHRHAVASIFRRRSHHPA
jgi:hypothetical protein